MPQQYPFSAILGCQPDAGDDMDGMGLALILATISPEIGGVLIRGEKGTAKSTAVRALADVLPPVEVYAADRFSIDPGDPSATSPDGPFTPEAETLQRPTRLVELPVGATENRVVGSLQLERALSEGAIDFEPGLLAKAHRGLLYVDEINLLHDHLVDLLLDAAAMGHSSVERDGFSVEHAARFALVGTMNPEEGELRPQLLDRFGLTIEVTAPRDPQARAEVIRRRIAFDADPAGFAAHYETTDQVLRERIHKAQSQVGSIRLTDPVLGKIAEICATFEVDGLRADIVTARAAAAHAAWQGRDRITRADIRQAALLALPHRRRRNPFDAPGLDEDLLDRLLDDDDFDPDPPEGPDSPDDPPPGGQEPRDDSGTDTSPEASSDESDGSDDGTPSEGPANENEPAEQPVDETADSPNTETSAEVTTSQDPSTDPEDADQPEQPPTGGSSSESTVAAAQPYRPRLFTVQGLGEGAPGRRSRALSSTGRRVGARPSTDGTGSLDLVETLMAAAPQQPTRHRMGRRVALQADDLRVAVREGREANLALFCVDASGSMAARKRMTQVKTAILSLLLDAYRRRDKVGLVTFRGEGADVALPPTRSVDIAAARLGELPAGGRTPLAEGLLQSTRVLARERVRDPRLRPLLIVVTDGRATGGRDAVARSRQAADHVAELGVSTVVLDAESGPMRLGLAARLAENLRAEYSPVGEVNAEMLTATVATRMQEAA